MRRPGRKITLAQAIKQGSRIVMFYCEAPDCWHSGEARLIEMLDSYGAETRLDELPARCTKCGRADRVDVRSRPFHRIGGHPLGDFAESDGLPY